MFRIASELINYIIYINSIQHYCKTFFSLLLMKIYDRFSSILLLYFSFRNNPVRYSIPMAQLFREL